MPKKIDSSPTFESSEAQAALDEVRADPEKAQAEDKRLKEEQARRMQEDDDKAREEVSKDYAKIPTAYRGCTLENFATSTPDGEPHPGLVSVHAAINRYLEKGIWQTRTDDDGKIINGQGLLMCGAAGSGKTHLAIAILAELKKRTPSKWRRTCFVDLGAFLANCSATAGYAKEAEYDDSTWKNLSILKGSSGNVPPLAMVLDDLGASRLTDAKKDTLRDLLNWADARDVRLIITTNAPKHEMLPDEIRETKLAEAQRRLGSATGDDRAAIEAQVRILERTPFLEDDRTRSRLAKACAYITVNAPDYRAHGFLDLDKQENQT